jgi:hypothetical protein
MNQAEAVTPRHHVFGGVRVAQWTQALAWPAGAELEVVAAQNVDVPVLQRGERRTDLRTTPGPKRRSTNASEV